MNKCTHSQTQSLSLSLSLSLFSEFPFDKKSQERGAVKLNQK